MDELEVIHTDDEVVLHAEKVSKIYPGTKALDEVSFDVYKGKTNVLIGSRALSRSLRANSSWAAKKFTSTTCRKRVRTESASFTKS